MTRYRSGKSRDAIRDARRVLLDATASSEARSRARGTLVGLLDTRRRDGSPAYGIRLEACRVLMQDPARFPA